MELDIKTLKNLVISKKDELTKLIGSAYKQLTTPKK
jgi:hypothetical protein